jgi:hypothetical protein
MFLGEYKFAIDDLFSKLEQKASISSSVMLQQSLNEYLLREV